MPSGAWILSEMLAVAMRAAAEGAWPSSSRVGKIKFLTRIRASFTVLGGVATPVLKEAAVMRRVAEILRLKIPIL